MNSKKYYFFVIILITVLNLGNTAIPQNCELFISAGSAGLEAGNYFRVWVNDTELTLNRYRGLNFAQIDPYTKQLISSTYFDTHCCSDRTAAMVTYINQIPSGIIVVVGVIDEAASHMSNEAYAALSKLGFSGTLTYRSGYVLIGGKERKASNKFIQQHSSRSATSSVSMCITEKIPNNCSKYLSVQSGGQLDWTRFQYYMNYQAQDVSWQTRGHNIQVFDSQTGAVKQRAGFDTLGNAAKATEMVNFINAIDTGDWVIIGIQDEGGTNLNNSVYSAIQSVGGPSNLNIAYRDSFALIGKKGESPNTATYLHRLNEQGGVQIDRCILGCNYQCTTCSMEPNQCTSCSRTLNINSSTCLCQDSYYENSSQVCVKCLLKCAKCENGSSCTECSNGIGRSASCSCSSGYYEIQGDNKDCGQCQYPCGNCSGSGTSCTSCKTTVGRISQTNCSCQNGYYESGSECKPCIYPCQNCSSDTICLSCQTTANRVSTTNCNCQPTYFDNNSSCQSCIYPCQNCSVSNNSCTSCKTTVGRVSSTNCSCKDTFYESGSECKSCEYPCLNCSSATVCLSCNTTVNRISLTNCDCQPTFFDNGSSCQACVYPCGNCFESNNSCTSCKTEIGRVSSIDCSCKDTFYESGSECKPCVYPCLNCSSENVCLSCSTTAHRVSLTNCNCQPTYYDNDSLCTQCIYPCLNCSSENICESCKTTENRISTTNCGCQDGYYDNNEICTPCIYPCLHCTSQTQCTACVIDNNRSNSHPCTCNSHYFDNLTNCQECHYKCGECKGQFDTCDTQCSDTINRDFNQNCECKEGFYDIENVANCGICSYKCQSCSETSTKCSICADLDTRDSSTTDCLCKKGFYDILNQAVCGTCNYPCQACLGSADNCTECSNETRPELPDCQCQSGYYDDTFNNPECLQCNYKCKECQQESTKCTECSHSTRNNLNDQCICKDGWFDDGFDNSECQKCIHPCVNCTSLQVCTSCVVGTNRKTFNDACICNDGFFDNSTDGDCQKCNFKCLTCIDNPTNCIQCSELTRVGEDCHCKDNYFEIGVSQCSKCEYQCNTCVDQANNCLNCSEDNRDINNECKCKSGYYENDQKKCVKCIYPCLTCQSINICNECVSQGPERQKPFCQCANGFYENTDLKQCLVCDTQCKTCAFSSQNCVICKPGQGRYKSPSCLCKDSFYLSQDQQTCEKCNSQCATCNNDTSCITCLVQGALPPFCNEVSQLASFSVNIGQNNIVSQAQCSPQCNECKDKAENCLNCKVGQNRKNNPPSCECQESYYPVDYSNDCQKCHPLCQICNSYNVCQKCLDLPNRVLNQFSGQCECKKGFKENQKQECEICYQYQNNCVFICPENTIPNEINKICFDVQVTSQDNTIIIIISLLSLIAGMAIKGFFFIIKSKSQIKALVNQQNQVSNNSDSSPIDIKQSQNNLKIGDFNL